MQAWIGPKVAPTLGAAEWQAVVASPRPWQEGGSRSADGPVNVACKIIAGHSAAPVRPEAWSSLPLFSTLTLCVSRLLTEDLPQGADHMRNLKFSNFQLEA